MVGRGENQILDLGKDGCIIGGMMYIIGGMKKCIMMYIGFLSLKTHVRWHIWFSSFYQLWFFELENPCVLMHMVLRSLQPWISELENHVCQHKWFSSSLQLWIFGLENHMRWISKLQNPCVSAHMVFKMFSILDF
jgi:hypothetical protein